jgi:hypothetical protein
VSVDSQEGYESYLADEERQAHRALLEGVDVGAAAPAGGGRVYPGDRRRAAGSPRTAAIPMTERRS